MINQVLVVKTLRNIDYLKELLSQGYRITCSLNNNYVLTCQSGNVFTKMFLIFTLF
jgi:hypothetical protein